MMSKILIIEDDDLLLRALTYGLEKEGYEVHTAKDGMAGMNLLKAQTFDLVITDLLIPFIGGLELLSFIKANMTTPVIILSATGLEEIVHEAFTKGADDFVTKPFNLGELTIRVQRHIRQQA